MPPPFLPRDQIQFSAMNTHSTHSATTSADAPTSAHTHREPPASLSLNVDAARISFILAVAAWPLAIMGFVHKVFLMPHNDNPTDDFTTVWSALNRFREGVPVYAEDYATTDPHYLYSPGGTLLLSPLSLIPDFDLGRILFIFANGLAIVAALAILTRLFGFSLKGGAWPVSIAIVFATESVENTLHFSNVNGMLLLAEVLFLFLLVRYRSLLPQILAGVCLGLAITVKPQFAPLLFIPFVRRQFSAVAAGVAVPVLLNVAALPLMASPSDYLDKLLPYLGEVRDYANSSISGVGVYYGASDGLILFWRFLAAFAVAVAIILLLRWRDRDPLMWAATTASLLLTGVFLISALGQMYYSMMLLPMIFTVCRHRSVMHNPIIWLGIYFCFSLDTWFSDRWRWWGAIFEYTRGTIGWSLILLSAAAAITTWTVLELRRGEKLLGDVKTFGLFGARPTPTSRVPASVEGSTVRQSASPASIKERRAAQR